MALTDLVRVYEGSSTDDAIAWLTAHKAEVESALRDKGAVLLRGFKTSGESLAEEALRVFSKDLLDDAFWSTPRKGVQGKTFTATEYPGPRTISLHCEMAYMRTFPRLLAFHSIIVAEQGGETTLGNLDAISKDLADLLPAFQGGVMYERNYHPGVDIPWQSAFQTEDRADVERMGKRLDMKIEWRGDSLRTRHTAQGCISSTAGPLWFNQTHVFHASNLSDGDRQTLTELFGEDGLPRNAYFANGQPIPNETMARVQTTLEKHTEPVPWAPGDVLVVDNLRHMHGRLPYSGKRKLHVAMAQAHKEAARTPLLEPKGLFGRLFG